MRTFFDSAIFYLITFLLFPVILAGYLFWITMLFAGRRSGVSGTAQGPLSARWFQHQLGIRSDEPAQRLLIMLPGVSPLAVWLVFGPLLLAHRISGYVPGSFRYPFKGKITLQNQASARQTFYDSAVDRYLPGIAQFVILGAGFDTRAYRLPEGTPVRSFEVDISETIAVKSQVLQHAGIELEGIMFVSADFEKGDWLSKLVDAGFDAGKPALFLWEGVTPYLDRTAVEDTLRKIASNARGSIVAFDYFTTEVLESQALYLRMLRASLKAGGESLKFGLDSTPPSRDRLTELLRSCGLSLREQRTLGDETREKRALGGFVIAVVE